MSKLLLKEFYELCPDGMCLDVLTESEKRQMSDGKALYLVGKCHEAERLNGNGRVYPFPILKREVDNYMNVVRDRRAVGELPIFKNKSLSRLFVVSQKNLSERR